MNPTNRQGDIQPFLEDGRPIVSARPVASSPTPRVVWRAKAAPRRPTLAPPLAKPPRVSVVIPALNEAENLEHVLPALPDGLYEVVLVDGSSSDGTCAAARRLHPDIHLVSQTRRGKGNALACGFAACTGDIIVMLDADGSADPAEIPRFVDALVEGADFAKGSRNLRGGGSADITRIRSCGNRFLSFLVNRLCQSKFTDLCYGYNAFWAAKCLSVLDLDWTSPPPDDGDGRLWGDGFEIETLIHVRIAKAGLKVVEVPSYELSRLHGVSNLNAPRDGLRVLRTILSEARRARRHGRADSDLAITGRASTCNGDARSPVVDIEEHLQRRIAAPATGTSAMATTPSGKTASTPSTSTPWS